MAHEIGVWLFGQAVGTLSLQGGRLAFQYGQGWLARQDGVALSQPVTFDTLSDCTKNLVTVNFDRVK